jgi:hypothetical protein
MINPVFNIHDMGFVRFLRFLLRHIYVILEKWWLE